MKHPGEVCPWHEYEAESPYGRDFFEQATVQQRVFWETLMGSLAAADDLGLTDDPTFSDGLVRTIENAHPALLV